MLPVRHPLQQPGITLGVLLAALGVGLMLFGFQCFPELLLGWLIVMLVQVLVCRLDKRAIDQDNEEGAAMIRLSATPLRFILLLSAVLFVALKTDRHLIAFCSSMVIANLYYLATELSGLIKEKP